MTRYWLEEECQQLRVKSANKYYVWHCMLGQHYAFVAIEVVLMTNFLEQKVIMMYMSCAKSV